MSKGLPIGHQIVNKWTPSGKDDKERQETIGRQDVFSCIHQSYCEFADDDEDVVHNCTIFLCSLDVRNIVQGGDPLYAGFFSTQGSGGYT